MYCNRCGKPIPNGSTFCNVCGAAQTNMQPQMQVPPQQYRQQTPPAPLPAAYIAVSWITFAAFIIWGIIKGSSVLVNGDDEQVYKAFVVCLAACVFIPQIRIKSLDGIPWVVYIIKIVVALLVVLLL